jgi:hypothetical protein
MTVQKGRLYKQKTEWNSTKSSLFR